MREFNYGPLHDEERMVWWICSTIEMGIKSNDDFSWRHMNAHIIHILCFNLAILKYFFALLPLGT